MLQSEFYEKLNENYNLFKSGILSKPSDHIFGAAYEIVYKEEIFDILLSEEFSDDIINVLASQADILEYIYQIWLGYDYSSMDNMRSVIRSIK